MNFTYIFLLSLTINRLLFHMFEDDFNIKDQLKTSVPFICYARNDNIGAHIKMFMVNSFNTPNHNSVYIKDMYSFDLNGKIKKEPTEESTVQNTFTEQTTFESTGIDEPSRTSKGSPLMSNVEYHSIKLEVVASSGRNKRNSLRQWVTLKFDGFSADLINIKERCNEKRCYLNLSDTEMLINTVRPVGESWGCDKLSTEFGFYWFIKTTSKIKDGVK